MKLCMVLLIMLLFEIRAKINKCESDLFEGCFCGMQFYEGVSMFVVNCTGQGFKDTKILKELPEETEMLIFTGNHIKTIPSNVFGAETYLSMLKIIDFSNNGIVEINGKAFHHVTTVERLILNHNDIFISTLAQSTEQNFRHPRVFSNFDNLQELHLTNAFADNSDAALAYHLHNIFVSSNLTKLLKLHLEQNEIKSFEDDRVFCALRNLQHLYLGNNNIPNLNFNITCLHQLVYLDLEGNNITNFSDHDLKTFDQLTVPLHPENLVIDIDENPFGCDSVINNLYNWLLKTKVLIRHLERLECQQSQNVKKFIMDLKNSDEEQHSKLSHTIFVLVIVLVVFLITVVTIYIYLKKEIVKERFIDVMFRKVQYSTIESQNV